MQEGELEASSPKNPDHLPAASGPSQMGQMEILLGIIQARLQAQMNTFRLVTSKASILIGFAAVFVVAPVPAASYGTDWLWRMHLCIFICLISALCAIFPRAVDEPGLRQVDKEFGGSDALEAVKWLISTSITSYEENARKLSFSTFVFITGFIFFVLAISIYVALQILHHG